MKTNKKTVKKQILAMICALCMVITLLPTAVFAAGSTHSPTRWSEVQTFIDNASEGDTIDLTALKNTIADTTLTITKNITLKGDYEASFPYSSYQMFNVYLVVTGNATVTLEKLAIENKKPDKSVVSGTGNLIVDGTIIESSTRNDVVTTYTPAATVDLNGDVTVLGDACEINNLGVFTTIISGASILDRDGEHTGTAGVAIKAVNVTVKGGRVAGGLSFEPGCSGGNAIVASGDVTVNGTLKEGSSTEYLDTTVIMGGQGAAGGNAVYADGNVTMTGGECYGGFATASTDIGVGGSGIITYGNVTMTGERLSRNDKSFYTTYIQSGKGEYAAGIPLQMLAKTGNPQRTLLLKTASIIGVNQLQPNGYSAPYIVDMQENDLAVIDDSTIGWYTDVPLFSKGSYSITNPFATWGTLANATEAFKITAEKADLTGVKTVVDGTNTSYYAQKDTQVTVTASAPETGYVFDKWTSDDVTFANAANGKTTFAMPQKAVELKATYKAPAPVAPTLTIMQPNVVFGTAINPAIVTNSKGAQTVEYKLASADDNTYTAAKPTAVGNYMVRVTVASTSIYSAATQAVAFAITPKPAVVLPPVVSNDAPKAVIDDDSQSVLDAVLTDADRQVIANGADYSIHLKVEKSTPSAEDKSKAESVLGKMKMGMFLDISLMKNINGVESKIETLNGKIKIVVDIPAELLKTGRTFSIVRVHNGIAEVLNDLDSNSNTVTFETDRFSTYAITYTEPDTSPVPETGNNAPVIPIVVLAVVSLAIVLLTRKKEYRVK